MKGPGFGEVNFGAVAGAVAGSFGGLFAVGIPPAILGRNPTLLLGTPLLSLISWIICLVVGWFLGGQLGPRAGVALKSPKAEIVVGALAGLLPVCLIMCWSYYMITRPGSSGPVP